MRPSLVLALVLLSAACRGPDVSKDDVDTDLVAADLDHDGVRGAEDCDDSDPAVRPGAPELCNEVDDDCDDAVDEDALDATAWFADSDADGHGDAASVTSSCEAPPGAVAVGDDCDDADALVGPGTAEVCNGLDDDCDALIDDRDPDVAPAGVWHPDLDGDGAGSAVQIAACAQPAGSVSSADDCQDADASVRPGAPELCDGKDNDCDGLTDDADALAVGAGTAGWADTDGDGHGAGAPVLRCVAPTGVVAVGDDCDDAAVGVHPGAAELCDGADQDCDGLIDGDDPDVAPGSVVRWYADLDGDGHAGSAQSALACTAPPGHQLTPDDCLDVDPRVFPGAPERCDGLDQDCDGAIDDAPVDGATFFADLDADGFGGATSTTACAAPAGFVALPGDCADAVAAVHPGAGERCGGGDDDCDGLEDDADPELSGAPLWFADLDGDGHAGAFATTRACLAPAGAQASADDCNDANAAIAPGAAELCNRVDDDCDSLIDDADADVADARSWSVDADGDGFGGAVVSLACAQPAGAVAAGGDCDDGAAGVHPGAGERCGGGDEDCDGLLDDADADLSGAPRWFADLDGDGFAGGFLSTTSCVAPPGGSATADDCVDANAAVHPGAIERCNGADDDCDGLLDDADLGVTYSGDDVYFADSDGDGWGAPGGGVACAPPAGSVDHAGDCDDALAAVRPGALEVCDGGDNDCDGLVDDADPGLDAASGTRFAVDSDGDGHGAVGSAVYACALPGPSFTTLADDCNDGSAAQAPGAAELCNGLDDDCDGLLDDADAVTSAPTWYPDADHDGWGGAGAGIAACAPPAGYGADQSDCDDSTAAIAPFAPEQCNGHDDDCDGLVDDADPGLSAQGALWFADDDHDGWGASSRVACQNFGFGWTDQLGDCHDGSAGIHPGALEVCDGQDNDCDGAADNEASDGAVWYVDADFDGWGDAGQPVRVCGYAWGLASRAGDCEDTNSARNPDRAELCDGVDNDCDGVVDLDTPGLPRWYTDFDGDGYGVTSSGVAACVAPSGRVNAGGDCADGNLNIHPGAAEIDRNHIDDDCDGNIDLPVPVTGAIINTNTVWGTLDPLLIVHNNLLVTAGTMLTIMPCTRVLFDPGTTLQIEGTLIAQGTPECPIVLTSSQGDPQPGDWSRVFFTATAQGANVDAAGGWHGGSVLQYVDVLYSGGVTAAVHVQSSTGPLLDHVRVAYSGGEGVASGAASMWVGASTFEDNRGNGLSSGAAYNGTTIVDSLFQRNGGSGAALAGGCCGAAPRPIHGNRFLNNAGSGFAVSGDYESWTITDNDFIGNAGAGLDTFNAAGRHARNRMIGNGVGLRAGYSGQHIIEDNIIAENGLALATQYGGSYEVRHNQFVRNGTNHNGGATWSPTFYVEDNLFQGMTSATAAVWQFPNISMGSFGGLLNDNNFIGEQGLDALNVGYIAGSPMVNAESNYWDGADLAAAGDMVYDFLDNAVYTVVDLEPVLAAPSIDAPVSYPTGLVASAAGGWHLSWDASPEADVVGYRVWYGVGDVWELAGTTAAEGASGFVVNGTSATLTGLDPAMVWTVAVTAIDGDADGLEDGLDGSESWYSEGALLVP